MRFCTSPWEMRFSEIILLGVSKITKMKKKKEFHLLSPLNRFQIFPFYILIDEASEYAKNHGFKIFNSLAT